MYMRFLSPPLSQHFQFTGQLINIIKILSHSIPLTMKFITLFATTLALGFIDGSAAASNSCYDSGHRFSPGPMYVHAKNACEGWSGNRGAFQGSFGPGQTKSVCVANAGANAGNTDTHLVMEVRNEDTGRSWDLNDADCTKEFYNLIEACTVGDFSGGQSRGGTRQNSGWWFRWGIRKCDHIPDCALTPDSIDPNSGKAC